MKTRKKAYVGLAVDIIHEGHINILKIANSYGDVIVGLLTDEAIASYKSIPYLNYNRRKIAFKKGKGSFLYAINGKNGEILWEFRTETPSGIFSSRFEVLNQNA